MGLNMRMRWRKWTRIVSEGIPVSTSVSAFGYKHELRKRWPSIDSTVDPRYP